MSPLVNAVLGVFFLGVGVAATLLMYHLRGGAARHAAPTAPPTERLDVEAAGEPTESSQLARWKRSSDDVERHLDEIHTIAETGRSIIEPMRTRKATTSWDDLLIKGAQLATLPLNDEEPVCTETILGPRAAKPLVIDTPIMVSHMSFGALSREIKTALARGSAAVGTAICSGEGGLLEDEWANAHRYIFEYVPNRYSVTDENLRRVSAIEIKFGQSAKPGMGGHLPGNKVTSEIAAVRGRQEGRDIISPAHFSDVHSPDDLRRLVDSLRRDPRGGRSASRSPPGTWKPIWLLPWLPGPISLPWTAEPGLRELRRNA